MDDSQQLREQLWDLVYGLLSDEESQALIARVKSDPRVARLYSEVRLQAELVGHAARIVDRSLVLKGDKVELPKDKPSRNAPSKKQQSGAWLTSLATGALAALLTLGFVWPQIAIRRSSVAFVATDVLASGEMPAGLTNKITLRTYRLDEQRQPAEGVPAEVVVRLRGTEGNETFSKAVMTSQLGLATVELPGAALEPGVRLEVADALSKDANRVSDKQAAAAPVALVAQLPIRPEPQFSYFLQGEPGLYADRPVDFSLWSFSAFSSKPAPIEASTASTQTAGGAGAADAVISGKVDKGIVAGRFQSTLSRKENLAAGDESKKQVEGQPSAIVETENIARRAPVNAGLANRGPNSQLAESGLRQSQPAASPAPEQAAKPIDKAAQSKAELALVQPSPPATQIPTEQQVPKLQTRTSVEAGQPLKLSVPPAWRDKPLLVAAICRGVTVTTIPIGGESQRSKVKPDANQAGSDGEIEIPLPPEAEGPIEVEIFDPASAANEPIDRQFFTRQPQRKLQIFMPGLKERFAPGDEAQITFQVTTESGQPAADTRLGVRVWNEQAIERTGQQPMLLTDAVVNGGDDGSAVATNQLAQSNLTLELAKPTDSDMAFGRGARAGEAEVAPITLVSNRDVVTSDMNAAAAINQDQALRVQRAVGMAAVIGGTALLLLMAVLSLLRMIGTARTWLPAVVAVAASALLGVYWLDWLPREKIDQLALATSAGRSATATTPAESAQAPLRDAQANSAPEESSLAADKKSADVEYRTEKETVKSDSTLARSAGVAGGLPAAAAPAPAGGPLLAPATAPGQTEKLVESGERLDRAAVKSTPARESSAALGGFAPPQSAIRGLAAGAASPPAVPKADTASLPSALYFNPQLMTDAEGRATIRFKLPATSCEYRLLIDALGQGRIGSGQARIAVVAER